ncbi:hypothetical protein [Brevibacillus reuszeri]|uniref:hypothetical protein n=1 Tax=Brevibacillus reuszeri TaxID=54915 RepID=UPI003D1DA5EF
MGNKKWVFTRLGEEKWKQSRLPDYQDDTHDEGKEVPITCHKYCQVWAKNGWVKTE